MNSLEINAIMNNELWKKNYGGIFPCDKIPKNLCKTCNFGIICNLSKSTSLGTQWIAIFMPAEGACLQYFDSYGMPPTNKYFLEFLEKNNKLYCYNEGQIQKFGSDVCGEYCIFFLLLRFSGVEYDNIINIFTNDLEQNDKFVSNFVNSIKCVKY